jgi:hypothetical protein
MQQNMRWVESLGAADRLLEQFDVLQLGVIQTSGADYVRRTLSTDHKGVWGLMGTRDSTEQIFR